MSEETIDCLPDDCPVRALGTNGNILFFLDSIGQLIALTPNQLGTWGNQISLFGGVRYLQKTFPDAATKNGFSSYRVTEALIRACHDKGIVHLPRDRSRVFV